MVESESGNDVMLDLEEREQVNSDPVTDPQESEIQ